MWKVFENTAVGDLCDTSQLEINRRISKCHQHHFMSVIILFTFINLGSNTFTKVFRFCPLNQEMSIISFT